MSKNNVPYYIAGTLATPTLLASGVFAVAPYIGFLAPVAALSVGLPFIIGCAVFSVVTIALSYAAISKNKTISEKDTQLADEKSKAEAKDKTISEKDTQLAEKSTDISNLRNQLDEEKAKVQTQGKTISERDAQLAEKSTKISSLEKQLAKNKIIVNLNKDDKLKRQHRKEKQKEVLDCADLSNLFGENSEKKAKVSSSANEPAKGENGQGWAVWGKTKVAATAITGIPLCDAALYYATQYIPTLLNEVLYAGSERGHTKSIV